MCARLPWLLAIPHVAFATSALLLFADGGLLYDYFPYFTPPMDRFGIGLGLTLAVKESAFLLWILAAVLSEKRLLQQVIVLDSLGYSRWQCLNWLLLPSVAPSLAMAMLLLAAYVLLSYLLWRSWRRTIPRVDGIRNACHTFITRHYAGEFFTLNRCAVCGSAGDPRGSVDDQ